MHGIGAQNHAFGASAFQTPNGIFEHAGQVIPSAFVLRLLNGPEIDAVHQYLRGAQWPQAAAHLLVDEFVIFGTGFPAHAADKANNAGVLTA